MTKLQRTTITSNGVAMQHEDIAKLFGVTKQRVWQIERTAIRKLWRNSVIEHRKVINKHEN